MKYWKKRLAAVLALGLCLTLSLPALAADPSEWEAQGFMMLDDMLDIYLGEESDVVIPDGVAKIGPNSFAGAAEQLTSVTIPDSVTAIEEGAFYGCVNLTSVVIPDSVQTIGSGAFQDCSSLVEVTMPQRFLASSEDCFSGTPWLTAYLSEHTVQAGADFVVEGTRLNDYQGAGGDVVIPDGITVIGKNAFKECDNLTGVTIPDSVTTIESGAFMDCLRLTQVTIPDSVTEIQAQAFYYCVSLAQVEMGANLEVLGSGTFEGCRSLTEITIPSGRISSIAFRDCENLARVTLGDGVTQIDELAFKGCGSLTQMTFGHGLERIDHEALCQTALTTVVLYDGLTSIGERAFPSTVQELAIPASVSQIDSEALDYCKGAVLHVEEGSEAENFALRHNLNYESDYQDFIKTAQSGGQETAPEDAAAQDQPVSQPTQEDSSGSPVVIILVVIVAAAAAGGGYLVLKKKKG